jgi:hypothetical protein
MNFITHATDYIRTIGNGNYNVAVVERSQIIDLFDETRNQNGQSPEMILDSYLFMNEADISVRMYFDHVEPIQHEKVTLRFFDLMKHMHFNGETTLHMQNKNQVDKNLTKESIKRGHIIDWLNDIITGRVAYKKVEIVLI